MIKAIPIKDGVQNGEAKMFSLNQWEKMQKAFGKDLAWREVKEIKPKQIIRKTKTKTNEK